MGHIVGVECHLLPYSVLLRPQPVGLQLVLEGSFFTANVHIWMLFHYPPPKVVPGFKWLGMAASVKILCKEEYKPWK